MGRMEEKQNKPKTAADGIDIPTAASEVNEEWFHKLLYPEIRNENEIQVDFVEGLNKGDHFMSNMQFININHDGQRIFDLVVKFMPSAHHHQEILKVMRAFDKEVEFYTKIMKDIKRRMPMVTMSLPRCFYGSVGDGKAAIVLENMARKGYTMKNKLKGLEKQYVKLALKELSKLHAAGLSLKITLDHSLPETYPELAHNHFNEEFGKYLQIAAEKCISLMERYGMEEEKLNRLQQYFSKTDLYRKRQQLTAPIEPLATVLHGDCWTNNLLFKPSKTNPFKPESVCFVDFQLCRYGHPALDLVYFLYTSTTREFRQAHLNGLLVSYYKYFLKNLRKCHVNLSAQQHPLEDFLEDFYSVTEYGFMVCVFLLPKILQQSDNAPDLGKKEEWEGKDLEGNVSTGMEVAMERLAGVIDDMIDLGVL